MFTAEGHSVFSWGHHSRGDLRPLWPAPNPDLLDEFQKTGCDLQSNKITREFLRNFDVVVLMHSPILLELNLDAFVDVPVVVRTIGQSTVAMERTYRRLGDRIKIVRYSDRETLIEGFAKTDAVIYFGKFSSDFAPWRGTGKGLTFHNSYARRSRFTVPRLPFWKTVNAKTGSELWGVGNEPISLARGKAPADVMPIMLSQAGWYFYVYIYPTSYTLNLIEALLAGVPVVAPSVNYVETTYKKQFGKAWSRNRYEVDEIVGNGGIFYDDIAQAIEATKTLEANRDYALDLSQSARQNAVRRFSAEMIAPQWSRFLSSVG
jgi:glycosyltransferase involved in cell wall biosynthesis